MNSPFARQVIQHILRTEWDLLLDAGRAWNQAEKDDVIPQLIIITALFGNGPKPAHLPFERHAEVS